MISETEKIMRPLQWLAAGDQHARDVLIRALRNGGVTPNLMHNLINGYLSDMGEDESDKPNDVIGSREGTSQTY